MSRRWFHIRQSVGWGSGGVRGGSDIRPTLTYAERSERNRFFFSHINSLACHRVQESPIIFDCVKLLLMNQGMLFLFHSTMRQGCRLVVL